MTATISNELFSGCAGYCCDYCGKKYTRKHEYIKHKSLCEIWNTITTTSKRDDKCAEEEDSNIPSLDQMYRIMLEFAKEHNKMKHKLEECQKFINREKNKIDVLSTLNALESSYLYSNTPIFMDWIKSLEVNENDMNNFNDHNFITVATNVLLNGIKVFQNIHSIPIKCFEYKKNIFYVYSIDTNNDASNNTSSNSINNVPSSKKVWIKLSKEEYVNVLKCIHKKLFITICDWKKANIESFRKNDKLEEAYSKTIIKLMSIIDFDQEIVLNKIKSNLFMYFQKA
jgi:hypothetical protein